MKKRQEPIPDGARRCTSCEKVKPLAAFHYYPKAAKHASHCKACRRIYLAEYRRTERGIAKAAAYKARPDVVEGRRLYERQEARVASKAEHLRRYRETPRGKLRTNLANANALLRRAEAEGRRDRANALRRRVAAIGAELARLDRAGRALGLAV